MTPTHARFLFAKRLLYTGGRLAYVSSLGLAQHRNRELVKSVSRVLGYTERRPELMPHGLTDLVDGEPTIRLTSIQADAWQVTPYELGVIAAIVAHFQPRTLFEIGTFDGRTTLNMLLNAPADAQICTLDLPPDEHDLPDGKRSGQMLEGVEGAERITRLFGNSLRFDFSSYAGTVDLVFVDAGHDYPSASNDTRVARELTRGRPAVIIWHDYATFEGVTRAVDELIPQVPSPRFFGQIRDTSLACLLTG